MRTQMPNEKNNDSDDKVFDVAKPGDSSPSSTSKPVIVGHKNMIEDPMVKAAASATLDGVPEDEGEAKAKQESNENIGPHQAKEIKPLNTAGNTAEPTNSEPEKPAEVSAPDPTSSEPAKTEPEADKQAGASDSLPETDANKAADKSEKVDEEEQAKQAAIQHLIESKQYVVHVGESHHGKLNKTIAIIIGGVVLVLAAFAAYLLK